MGSQFEAIRRVIDAFEQSDWSEIDVRVGGVRVHLSTDATDRSSPTVTPAAAPVAEAHDPEPNDPAANGTHTPSATTTPDRAHLVVAPSPGIFWRSPEPGAAPFADVGDTVDASSTVCIIEVMKLMTHLKARVGGRVVAVYGENGVAVEKGEPLFAILPAGAAG